MTNADEQNMGQMGQMGQDEQTVSGHSEEQGTGAQMAQQGETPAELRDVLPQLSGGASTSRIKRTEGPQTLFYDGHYSHTKLHQDETYIPDFLGLASALGAEAIRVTTEEEVLPAIKRAREINDRPVVIDFVVNKDAMVWPMVWADSLAARWKSST